MEQYEYEHVFAQSIQEAEAILNDLGRAGWRFVGMGKSGSYVMERRHIPDPPQKPEKPPRG